MPITQNGVLKKDDNDQPVMGGTSSADNATIINSAFDPVTRRLLTDQAGGGTGTVTSVSVVTANGFAGTVATATTTPAITLTTTLNTPVLAGNGTALIAATTVGTGSTVVLQTSPTLITPVLGIATATTINKVTFTAPATGSTLTIADGKTLTVSNTLTFTGTDTSSVAFGAGGTVLYSASVIPLTIGTTTIASGTNTRILYDNSGVLGEYTITGTGTVVAMQTNPTLSGITMSDATNIVLNATTGTKIGTATTQKLAFYNSTPIAQPTGDVITALQNLGLGASLTIASATNINTATESTDTTCFPVFVTASGSQSLPAKTNTTLTYNSNTNDLGITKLNGLTMTASTGTFTLTNAKTLSVTNTLTLSGTDSTTMTFPSTTATIARTDAAQTFTGTQTFSQIVTTANAITASANAATVPITSRISNVTNNSAATLTITMTTTSAVDGMMVMVRVFDFSGVAQTITWVNTENSTVTAPTTSNGSTTLPKTVGFQYNSATSKWRCIASA